ncbi:unnamed protein product [Ectocarpus sp. CCAP 1310/34]|nr:unnamed protein product [Ectocarpus sp. CCAP 1310/34]
MVPKRGRLIGTLERKKALPLIVLGASRTMKLLLYHGGLPATFYSVGRWGFDDGSTSAYDSSASVRGVKSDQDDVVGGSVGYGKSGIVCTRKVAFRRLWQRVPPHIQDVHFDFNAKMWEPEDIDKLVQDGASHVRDQERFFERMAKFNLKLAPKKTNLGVKVVTFLGHQVTAEGIGPDPGKVRPLGEVPMPTNVSQLRSLLGSLSYYRKFLKNMSAF